MSGMYGIMPAMPRPAAADRRVSGRLAALEPSATLAVDARAKELLAKGEPVISFGAGEPDFPTPASVVAAAEAACADLPMQKYTPTAGLLRLRQAICDKSRRDSGLTLQPDQVLVTGGAKHAVYTAFATLCDPGDEVLIPSPYWTTYPESARLVGASPVAVPTSEADGWLVGTEALEAHCTPRTRLLLFNSPCNPTGAVYPPEQVEAIGRWALERGIWVISDEIYEHLVDATVRQVSMPVVVPELAERCLVINGVAKTYAMTGWRIGWVAGPRDVIAAAVNFQSQVTSNVANVSQRAAVAALEGDLAAAAEMAAAYDRRRAEMCKLLNEIDGITCSVPHGAFYCFPDVSGLLGRELAGRTSGTSAELAAHLLDTELVAVVPGEAFGAPGHVRLSCALSDDDLTEGLARLARFAAS